MERSRRAYVWFCGFLWIGMFWLNAVKVSAADPPEARLRNAQALLEESRYAEAERALQGLSQDAGPQDAAAVRVRVRALCALSRLSWENLRLDRAASQAQRAAELARHNGDGPGEFLALTRQVRALYLRDGKRADARRLFAELERRASSSLDPTTAVEFFILRGLLQRAQRHHDEARKSFEEAVARGGGSPQTVEALLELASLDIRLQHYGEAEKRLDEAGGVLAASPVSPFRQAALLEEEASMRLDQGRLAEAMRLMMATVVLFHTMSNPLYEADARLLLSGVFQAESNESAAEAQRHEAFAICAAAREPSSLRNVLTVRAGVLETSTDRTATARLVADLRQVLPCMTEPDDQVWAHMKLAWLLSRTLRDFRASDAELQAAWNAAHGAARNDLEAAVEGWWGAILMERPSGDAAAVSHLQHALALASTLPRVPLDAGEPFNFSDVAELHRMLGSIRVGQSRYEEASTLLHEALAEDAGEDRIEQRCNDLRMLIAIPLALQDLDQAEHLLNQVLDEIGRMQQPVSRAIYTSIVLFPLLGGQGTNRVQMLEDPWRAEMGDDSPGRLLLARVARDQILAERIRGACREWIAYAHRSFPSQESIALMVEGQVLDAFGQTEEALDSLSRGLDVARRQSLRIFLPLGYFLTAQIQLREGRLSDVESTARRAVKDLDDVMLAANQTQFLTLLAALRLRAHDTRGALTWAVRAVARAQVSREVSAEALALATQGRCLTAAGRLAEALAVYETGARLLHGKAETRDEGAMLILVARTQNGMRRREAAVQTYQRALDLLAAGGWTIELRGGVLEAGQCLASLGRTDAALKLYRDAIHAVVEWREQLPDRRGQQLISDQKATRQLFERAIGLLLARKENAEALRLLELSHSLELLGSVDVSALRADSAADRARLDKLSRLRRELAALRTQIQEADQKTRPTLEMTLASTREDFFSTLNEIRRSQADFDQLLSVRATDLAALQKSLAPDTLLVEYFPAPDALYALLVTRQGFEIRRIDVTRDRLAALVKSFRESISDPGIPLDSTESSATSTNLYELLVGSLGLDLATTLHPAAGGTAARPRYRHILVVPSGFLWYLPMAALRDARGRFLVQDAEISYLSSADVLNLIGQRGAERPPVRLLAVGDPTGSALPGARREVENISATFPGGCVLLGAQATREALLREAPRATVMHVASHSTLDAGDQNHSAIELADGPFRLSEVYGLHLSPGALVVLSSCDSALGEDNPGRELVSLATAFTSAGASTVIASLWRVDDNATADLMTSFYHLLRDGDTRAGALRDAQLHMLGQPATRHPYYWAGFTLMGEPR